MRARFAAPVGANRAETWHGVRRIARALHVVAYRIRLCLLAARVALLIALIGLLIVDAAISRAPFHREVVKP